MISIGNSVIFTGFFCGSSCPSTCGVSQSLVKNPLDLESASIQERSVGENTMIREKTASNLARDGVMLVGSSGLVGVLSLIGINQQSQETQSELRELQRSTQRLEAQSERTTQEVGDLRDDFRALSASDGELRDRITRMETLYERAPWEPKE